MIRCAVPAALSLVLAVVAARAYEPAVPPSPVEAVAPAKHSLTQDSENAGDNIFIGHFGETLRLDNCWAVDAKMQGPMERVNFHFKTVDPTNIFSAPFSPKATDFIPENFARLRLMQMLVIPKDVPGGFQSLDALREAKAKELSSTGNPFDLRQFGEYPWPPGTFSVSLSTPYPLFQLYTHSDKNFFIVTVGEDPFAAAPRDRYLASSASGLFHSLSTYAYNFVPPLVEELSATDVALAGVPWAGICTIALAFGFLPKKQPWLARLRLAARMMFGLSTAGLLLAIPILFVSMRLGLGRTINTASILLCAGLVLPWGCKTVSSRLNGRTIWRVFAWSAAVNIVPVMFGLEMVRHYYSGAEALTGALDFWMLGLTLSLVAILNGIAFGVAHQDGDP